MKEQLESIPGRDGAWDFGTQFDARPIEIDCVILADSKADLKQKVRDLAGLFNPRLGSRALIFDDEPDKLYFARLTGQLPIEQIGSFGSFTLQLICVDPFVYSSGETTSSGTSPLTVTQNGTHVATPVLTITKNSGAGTLTVTHSDGTFETLTFTPSAPSGVYVVNCKEFTITKDGAGAYKFVTGDFVTLHQGNNLITTTGSVTNIQVTFRNTWL